MSFTKVFGIITIALIIVFGAAFLIAQLRFVTSNHPVKPFMGDQKIEIQDFPSILLTIVFFLEILVLIPLLLGVVKEHDLDLSQQGLFMAGVLGFRNADQAFLYHEKAEDHLGEGRRVSTKSKLIRWAHAKSMRYLYLGNGDLPDELLNSQYARYDLERFGVLPARSAEEADCLIVSISINEKTAQLIKEVYEKMLPPQSVIAIGSFAVSGNLFGSIPLKSIISVDLSLMGVSRPEAVMEAILKVLEIRGGKNDK